jgi:hypothetical protein
LKINQSFEIGRGNVKLTYLSRFAVKFIEVAGAGVASALCAYFLGQIERSPAPATAVVQISPATIENAAQARVAVVAQNAADTRPERVSVAPAMPSAPKPEKSASTAPARRNQKSEQGVASAEPKARTGDPLAIDAAAISSNSAPKTTGQSIPTAAGRDAPAAWSGDEERPLLAGLKLIPSWFLPENDRIFGDLPRPPMPVGESLRSAM